MTTDRDLDHRLSAWFDLLATSTPPEGLLARSLERVGATRQRPGWLVRDRGGWGAGPAASRHGTRARFDLRWVVAVVAVALVATGAGLLLQLQPVTTVGPSLSPATSATISPRSTPTAASWTVTGSMGIARGGFSLTLLGNGKVLAAGGDARQEGVHTASAELYAPASGFWSFTGSMATARAGHTATLLPDGKVLVAGGGRQAEGFAYLASAELYDPSSGTWSAAGSMATPRSGHTATLLRDGKVLFVGGETESRDFPGNPEGVASAELYDPGAGTWTVVASMPTQRFGHAAALLPDGKVLVAGGACCGASPEVIASAVLYDPSSGNWTDTGTLNKPIYGTTATQLLGGEVLAVQPPFAEVYNPITGTWVATGAMVIPNAGCSVTLLLGGEVLVAGGTDRHLNQPWGAPIAGAELFNPSTRTWTATASMVTPRCGTAILLLDGRVLVAGGDETPGGHDSTPAELYDSGNGR